MAAAWDIPPFDGRGDKTPNPTYEAVGRALSAWEEVEVSLSHLFGIFTGKDPLSLATYAEYGKPSIFSHRADGLQDAASVYFVRNPNQAHEAEFADLICDIRKFSARRNDIAHGIVRPIVVGPPISIPDDDPAGEPWLQMNYEYCLLPPTYAGRRFGLDRTPQYVLPAAEIMQFQAAFTRLLARVAQLNFRLQGVL
jgi:hypothetical protein